MTTTPFAPRPHQAAAIEAIADTFGSRSGDDLRARLTMMCGTGKTLTAQRAVERLVADGVVPSTGRVLMLFPSLALVQQTFDSWVAQQMPGFGFRAIAFCSGVAPKRGSDEIAEDALTMERTTDPAVLVKWLLDETADEALSVVFGTYQSSANLAVIHREHDASPWDLMIADEAHNTTGDLTSIWATALHQSQIPSRHRLFMTATPKVHAKHGRKVANASDLGIASMSDESVYGPKVYDYSMPQAIQDQVLSDYEVVILGVTDREVRAYIEQHPESLALVSADAAHDEVLAAIALLKASKQFGLSRVLTFHRTIQRAEDFAARLQVIASSFPAEHLHTDSVQAFAVKGTDSTKHRKRALDALAATGNDQFTSISNCKVFAEGVDAPTLDGELIADARTSPTEITQIVGRCIRLNEMRDGKSIIVLPVLDDETLDATERLAGSSFDKVWQTLIALAEHDIEMQADLGRMMARWANAEALATSNQGNRGDDPGPHDAAHVGTPAPQEAETPPVGDPAAGAPENPADGFGLQKVNIQFASDLEPEAIFSAFEARVISTCVDNFDKRLADVAAFIEGHGHAPRTSPSATKREKSLGGWLTDRRSEDKNGSLSADRREAVALTLNPLLGDWNPNRDVVTTRRNRSWESMCDELARFYATEQRWPRRSTTATPDEVSLAIWLNGRRTEAQQDLLDPEREALLNAVGDWRDCPDAKFAAQAREVREWIDAHSGRMPRGKADNVTERRLGTRLTMNRYRARAGKFSPSRVQILVQAGLVEVDEMAASA